MKKWVYRCYFFPLSKYPLLHIKSVFTIPLWGSDSNTMIKVFISNTMGIGWFGFRLCLQHTVLSCKWHLFTGLLWHDISIVTDMACKTNGKTVHLFYNEKCISILNNLDKTVNQAFYHIWGSNRNWVQIMGWGGLSLNIFISIVKIFSVYKNILITLHLPNLASCEVFSCYHPKIMVKWQYVILQWSILMH